MNNDISAFSKGAFRSCRQLVIVYMFIVQYLSVNCAVLMHLSFTCITRMIDFGVVFVFIPALNVMGHGSHIRWVNGSWVNSSYPFACSAADEELENLVNTFAPNETLTSNFGVE